MTGRLLDIQPWFLEQPGSVERRRLGDLLTFEVEANDRFRVQYLHPRTSAPQRFPLSSKFVIQDVEALSLDSNLGICFDAGSSRVLNIRQIR